MPVLGLLVFELSTWYDTFDYVLGVYVEVWTNIKEARQNFLIFIEFKSDLLEVSLANII